MRLFRLPGNELGQTAEVAWLLTDELSLVRQPRAAEDGKAVGNRLMHRQLAHLVNNRMMRVACGEFSPGPCVPQGRSSVRPGGMCRVNENGARTIQKARV